MSTNSLGIQPADCIEDVCKYVEKHEGYKNAIHYIEQQYSAYTRYEKILASNSRSLAEKLPVLQKSLNSVKQVQKINESGKVNTKTFYELENGVYGIANIQPSETVTLYLGAMTLADYTIEEAISTLDSQLQSINEKVKQNDIDQTYLKKQMTTIEVSLSTIFNYPVTHKEHYQKMLQKYGNES